MAATVSYLDTYALPNKTDLLESGNIANYTW